MSEKDSAHSIIIDIPRFRTFATVSTRNVRKRTKKIVRDKVIRKPSDTTLRHYSLPSSKPLCINDLKKGTLLPPYRLYEKEQEVNKHKQRASIKLHERYKIINTELKNRLYVENRPDDVMAKMDIDENYFQFINKHPASHYIPVYKSLKFQFHERLRMRQEIGYKQDYILNIEENYRQENETYEQSVKKIADQVKHFDEFIAKDYKRSMVLLQKCEALVGNLNEQISLRENLAIQQFTIQSRLVGLDYFYFVQQKYGRFLYYLSPPSWRAHHRKFAHSVEIEAKGFDLGTSSEEETFNVIFQNMQQECSNGLVKPVLYFSYPSELIAMFEGMEEQYLNHFMQGVSLASITMELNKSVQKLKRSIQKDTALVAHLIEGFVGLVSFCEEREALLQVKFMKILNGLFHNTVAAPDVLRLKLNLEFYYEKLFREESLNKDCLSTAKALENMYMEYVFKLDAFTNDRLTKAIKRCIEKEGKKIKNAHIAARELRSFDILEHSLLRAHEKRTPYAVTTAAFSKVSSTRKLTRQIVKPIVRVSSLQYSLTEGEIEYLRLFTDWTTNEDPAKYLHSLSITERIYSINE